MGAPSYFRLFSIITLVFCFVCGPRNAKAQDIAVGEVMILADVLRHYAQNTDFYSLLEKDERKIIEDFKKYDILTLKNLPPATLKNLIDRFNAKFVGFKETREKLTKQIQSLKSRKIATALSDKKTIVDIDLKIEASEDQFKQARFVLFSTSIEANKALSEALNSKTVQAAMATSSAKPSSSGVVNNQAQTNPNGTPKMPATYQGSKVERMSTSEAEKLNLTPVDPEFYGTQLGKKLEKDLGGRADFWSYDFDQDELYVKVGDDVGKLRVKQKDQGTRIIQTRIGSDFQDFPNNYQGDEAVDLNKSQGRFLTGNSSEATLFGNFPSTEIPSISEDPVIKHKEGDGHKHTHKHK